MARTCLVIDILFHSGKVYLLIFDTSIVCYFPLSRTHTFTTLYNSTYSITENQMDIARYLVLQVSLSLRLEGLISILVVS